MCVLDTRTRPPLAIQRAVHSLPALLPTSLRPTNCYLHRDYDLHFEHPATPDTLHPYDMDITFAPLTFPFPMFVTFGFSGRDLDFSLR
jgi:hypothetical protein